MKIRHFVFGMTMFLFIVFSYGILEPILISYPDTLVVIAGVLYGVLIAPIIVWYFVAKYIQYVYNMKKKELK